MNIIILSYEFPPLGGGGAKVVQGLVTEFIGRGHNVDLITMWHRKLKLIERVDGVNVFRIPCIRLKQSMCYSFEMIPYVALAIPYALLLHLLRKYDINHTHFIFPDGFVAFVLKKLTGLQYIITAHGSDVPGYNPDRFITLHRLLLPIWRKVVAGSKGIVCPSMSIRSLIKSNYKDSRTYLIPNGINTEKFKPNIEKKNRILVVTRMFERKGVQYLIEALRHLNLDYETHLVGDGPYLKYLMGVVDEKHLDVRFWGFLDNQSNEIRELYETSRIFVLPSESENFPIVLLEAMAAGLAIITTEGTGCAEVVGHAALLVKPRSAESIYSALKQLAQNRQLCENLGRMARARLEEQFGWHSVADQYITLLKSESK